MPVISRRTCLGASSVLLAWLALDARALSGTGSGVIAGGHAEDPLDLSDFPSQPRSLVQETVGASHGNAARVAALLKERPQLANATWDWGFGDWETALGAASHVGNREIAAMLMEHGARPDIFTLAMLGNVDAVRAIIVSTPGIERSRGPHGFNLAHHARAGKDGAALVAEYLATVEGADLPYPSVPLDEAMRGTYLGRYRFGPGDTQVLEVLFQERQQVLSLGAVGGSWRGLTHLGDHTFHPAGAPSVRITFSFAETGGGAPASSLAISAPVPLITAKRF